MRKSTKKATKSKSKSTGRMSEEQVVAKILGPAGAELLRRHNAVKKTVAGIDPKNPSPQAVARAARGLSELLDTFIWCIQITFGIAQLQAALDRARYALTASEIAGMEKTLADARKWVSENCGTHSPK